MARSSAAMRAPVSLRSASGYMAAAAGKAARKLNSDAGRVKLAREKLEDLEVELGGKAVHCGAGGTVSKFVG